MGTTSERIEKIRGRYLNEAPKISIARAKYFTDSWRQTEGAGFSRGVRVALAMKNVYENMTHYVSPDDRIAGYWTESFMGIPIDIERGVFNTVFKTELDRSSIVNFRLRSFAGTFRYLLRTGSLSDFVRNVRSTRAAGPQPMNLELATMTEREINRFTIDAADRRILKKQLLPYWEGKTVIAQLDREILSSGLLGDEMRDFNLALPANTSRQTMMVSICSTISTYQGHVIIDYERVIRNGLLAMQAEVADIIETGNELTSEQLDFLQSLEIALEGVMIFARGLEAAIRDCVAKETDPAKKNALEALLANCAVVPLNPAKTFHQAVQSAWTVKTAIELAHPVNLHSFGRMDQIFYPYYERDIAEGRITREAAREILEELLLKIMSQNIRPESNILSNFYHRFLGSSPVTIGGLKPDGADGTNALTYLFLEAAANAHAVTNVSLRVHKDSPDELLLAAAETLYSGSSNISLFNDDVNVDAMRRRGFADEDARNYAVMGCVEMLCPGKTGGMSANALLLSRLLDVTLRNGDSMTLMGTIKNVGMKTGDIHSFDTFEKLENAFLTQARHQIKLIADASNIRDALFAKMLPAPYISAFIEGCLDSGKDVTAGGAAYDLSGISFINSIANITDSLYVMKKLVFDQKAFTLGELLEAINNNYVGHEKIHEQIKRLEGKWGNGCPEVDDLARRITSALFEETYKYQSHRGGVFVPYVISMTTHTIDGRISIATPDGRPAATPYAASCNPYNVEKGGVTAAMRSVASLDFRNVLGCAVNMKFHPSSIGAGEKSRRKWVALIRTYFQLGGAQLQPTVVSSDTLRSAQADPESYRDLIVKVGGYSAYFTELGREIQNEVIARTEHSLSAV